MAEKKYGVMAVFETPEQLLSAVIHMRGLGFTQLDALTPFPIHGMDEALGEKPSRLGYIVLAGGLAGMASALLLQWWTSAVAYPLVIGGKPPFSFEYSIPITFELTVLFASFAAVIGMFALNGLPKFYHPSFKYSQFAGATDDRFLLVVEGGNLDKAEESLKQLQASHVEVVEE
jgi:hypothetical protein